MDIDGVEIAPCECAIFRGKDVPGHAQRYCVLSCAKMADPIEVPFGFRRRVNPRIRVLRGVHSSTTWRIRLNRPRAAAMQPYVKLLSPLVITTSDHGP